MAAPRIAPADAPARTGTGREAMELAGG